MMSGDRTLWLWSTLPTKPLVVEDQTWRKEGDAVENVHRLQMGKILTRGPGFEPGLGQICPWSQEQLVGLHGLDDKILRYAYQRYQYWQ